MSESSSQQHFKDLILWALSHQDEIKYTQSITPTPRLAGHALYLVGLQYDQYLSLGVCCTSENVHGLGIALVECIERVGLFHNKKPNSNGIAAHFDKEVAKKNAYAELIERDAFLYALHWQRQLQRLPQSDKDFIFFQLPTRDSKLQCVLAISQSDEKIYGMGTSESLIEAIEKSRKEVVALWQTKEELGMPALNLKEFAALTKLEPTHHQQLSFSDEYQTALGKWPAVGLNVNSPAPIDISQVHFEELSLPAPYDETGLHIIRATHDDLLKYYIGSFAELEKQAAYKTYTAKFGSPSFILPHPFG